MLVIFIVVFAALKDEDSNKVTPQGLVDYYRLLLPPRIQQVTLESVVTSLYHQLCHKEDGNDLIPTAFGKLCQGN